MLTQVLNEAQERRLGPVEVVEEDEHRARESQGFEQAADSPGDLLRPREDVVEADGAGEPGDDEASVFGVGQEGEQLRARLVAAVLVLDPGERLQHDREWEVRDPLAVGDAAALEPPRALADHRRELVAQPRLAGTGLTEDRRDTTASILDSRIERLQELRQLE